MGKTFGVIRDPKVKLKACNALPFNNKYGEQVHLESCYIAVKDDLIAERASNPDVRAVINLSLAGKSPGCGSASPTKFYAINHVVESM